MSETSLTLVYDKVTEFVEDRKIQDHLIASLEDYYSDNNRYPREVIMSHDNATTYLKRYKQGQPFLVKYLGKTIIFTVNKRMKGHDLFMK
jgi:hypothetical protein